VTCGALQEVLVRGKEHGEKSGRQQQRQPLCFKCMAEKKMKGGTMCGQVEEKEGAGGVERGGGGGDQNPITAGVDGALREQGKEPAVDWRSRSKKMKSIQILKLIIETY
jgi:hypothetical protein